MTSLGSDFYTADIPGQPAGTTISYRIIAEDLRGMVQLGPSRGYKVVTINSPYYRVDTGYACTMQNISQTGTSITYDKFFINSAMTGAGTAPRDDGTAGPYDIGGTMRLFAGDTVRYAWVSVNGALALSKSATDTIDVNANGFATSGWDFPMLQHHYRADTNYPSRMPPNFIAPFWADMVIADTGATPAVYGKIVYGTGGDPCQFIVEWDSIGTFDQAGSTNDVTTFRTILNHCEGSIEYQYKSVGTQGLDSLALVGMQADSNDLTQPDPSVDPGFVFINRNTYPYETKPRDNWCIKMYAGMPVYVTSGWQMLSVATTGASTNGNDMSKATIYPTAASVAFRYASGYQPTDPLTNGPGYWLKFDKFTYAGGPGIPKNSVSIDVLTGWNMIGSIAKPVAVANIGLSSGLTIGTVYKYAGSYQAVTTITPGLGYWVKTNQPGTLTMTGSASLPKQEVADYSQINKVTIIDKAGRYQTLYIGEEGLVNAAGLDAGEWPPAAPSFDARFKNSNGMVATYPAKLEAAKYEYPISISTDAYPVIVKWEISKSAEKSLTLVSGGKLLGVLEGSGSMKVKNGAGLGLALNGNVNVPKVFALGQNYPNPFNPTTRFAVDVPRATNVEVAIYNVLGQKIVTLMNGEQEAGSYQMEWNAVDAHNQVVPTGIYFVRMTADNFSAVQKIMLMK
ncbi:MAG: T9SS type A sorting domain-containing protein [Ignavibacteriales bacterium]|nr:T9SS type A sorting domain-containing protein [Ignavibacteriales bacterium]